MSRKQNVLNAKYCLVVYTLVLQTPNNMHTIKHWLLHHVVEWISSAEAEKPQLKVRKPMYYLFSPLQICILFVMFYQVKSLKIYCLFFHLKKISSIVNLFCGNFRVGFLIVLPPLGLWTLIIKTCKLQSGKTRAALSLSVILHVL